VRCDLFWVGIRKIISDLGEGASIKQKMESIKKWCGKDDKTIYKVLDHLEFCDKNKLTYEGPRKTTVPAIPEYPLQSVRSMKDKKLQGKVVKELRKRIEKNKPLSQKDVQAAVEFATAGKPEPEKEQPCEVCAPRLRTAPGQSKWGTIQPETSGIKYTMFFKTEPNKITLKRETRTGFVEGPFDIPREVAPALLKILREWLNENKK